MKVIFVDIHNKPGKQPLDSSTLSGKTIDKIIAGIEEGVECVKDNFFHSTFIPKKNLHGYPLHLKSFIKRNQVQEDDILVLLGADVKECVGNFKGAYLLITLHPSLRYQQIKRDDYIYLTTGRINLLIKQINEIKKVNQNNTLQSVFESIQTELDYQNKMSADPNRPDMNPNMSMGDLLCAMEYNLQEAKKAWYRDSQPYSNTMEFVRKTTALGVKAGKQFGMPKRK